MKILMIHNKYQFQGGEDSVFQIESDMLSKHGHKVEQLIFDNKEIKGAFEKFLLVLRGIYNSQSAKELEKVIARFSPDIIHVHNFFPLASPSIFYVAKRKHIPVVVTLHNFRLICPTAVLYFHGKIYEKNIHSIIPWDGILKGVYRNSRLQTAGLAVITTFHNLIGTWRNKVNKFIVLTEFAQKKFKDSILRVSEDQFAVKPNFVEDNGYAQKAREDFFLIVGRLSEEKGILTILESLNLGTFKLVIIGDGPLKDQVQSAIRAKPNVTYLGFQQKPVIMDYLKRCRALLFPSVCYEGFSMTLLEAFSAGTPVIASKLGSMAEIVQDHENGLHFEPGNPQDMVDKINLINEDPDLAQKLSQNARKTYMDLYTPEKNYTILLDIYTQLLLRKNPAVKQ
ncbi:glycosyltransferase family 4 protein [Chryseolinea sp. H1M3-3]|uniref:glycosyltransferase family 4 protein n=1 Tax=Chryseolinea sp. H1M3-3 TaxID=3034144 RepID=UPI0023EB834D|nr:glycosyltransferase family 4 protein [Chryseolinea sp. H1M3-3]